MDGSLRSPALSQVYSSLTFHHSQTAVAKVEMSSNFPTVPIKLKPGSHIQGIPKNFLESEEQHIVGSPFNFVFVQVSDKTQNKCSKDSFIQIYN